MRRPSASLGRVVIAAASLILVAFLIALAFAVIAIHKWETEIVFRGWTDSIHDMTLDAEGNPCIAGIALVDRVETLAFAKRVSESWEVVPLAPVSREYNDISIAVDSQNKVHISAGSPMSGYSGDSRLTYLTDKNGSWTIQDIPIDGIYLSSRIAVDSQGLAHILYSEFEEITYHFTWNELTVSNASVMLMSETDGGWVKSEVFNSGMNTSTYISSFAIGGNDRMHALTKSYKYSAGMHSDMSETYLNYSTNATGSWIQEIFQQGPGEMKSASMVLDADGRVHICGYLWDDASSTYSMAYSSRQNSIWVISRLGYAGNTWPTSCGLAIDPHGAVHIAYYAHFFNQSARPQFNETERYLTNQDGAWKLRILYDKGGWLESERIHILVGPDDRVQISYFCDLGKEGMSNRYNVVFATPASLPAEIGTAVSDALVRALAIAPIVVVGAFIYRRRMIRVMTLKSDDADPGTGVRGPPSD